MPTRYTLALSLCLTAPLTAADDAPPPVGTVHEMRVVSVSLSVGSTGREAKRVVYAPPPGWYVRSHRVATTNQSGSVTYTVGTVPAGWNWTNHEQAAASGRVAGTAAVTLPNGLAAGGRAAGEQDSAMVGRQAATSSHHVLVVDVAARGGGLWQGGARVDLAVYAELVYLSR